MTIAEKEKKVLRNVTKREPRTAAEIADRIGIEEPRALSVPIGRLITAGLIAKAGGRPTKYVKV